MEPRFVDDVTQAARAWKGSSLIPGFYVLGAALSSVFVAVTPEPPTHCVQRDLQGNCPLTPDQVEPAMLMLLLLLPFGIFQVGMSGTMRVWYLRRFQGQDLTPGEVWSMTWKFWGRFFVLGLLFLLVSIPWVVVYFVVLADDSTTAALVILIAATVVSDVLLTFVVPGLALYQPSVGASVKGGLRVLRSTWPACALYALIPPLALTLLGRGAGRGHFKALAMIGALTGPPLTLLFAGATVAFLLRRYPPMSENGSLGYLPPLRIPDLRVPRV